MAFLKKYSSDMGTLMIVDSSIEFYENIFCKISAEKILEKDVFNNAIFLQFKKLSHILILALIIEKASHHRFTALLSKLKFYVKI